MSQAGGSSVYLRKDINWNCIVGVVGFIIKALFIWKGIYYQRVYVWLIFFNKKQEYIRVFVESTPTKNISIIYDHQLDSSKKTKTV